LTVAHRRLIDEIRRETARRGREQRSLVGAPPAELLQLSDELLDHARDDSLLLLFLCCHPALTPPSQIALTLRAVGGLSTRQIAAAFFVPEATMAQRISRAKQRIREAGASFSTPPGDEIDERVAAVQHVLYLIFNTGYTASTATKSDAIELTSEAIRLTRELRRQRPADAETAGLLALMLLTEARRAARSTDEGELVPLADQDRGLWDHELIGEGVELITEALSVGPLGAYQLQAAIAAVHDEAAHTDETDWPEVLALYELLHQIAPNPMASLNRAVALAMVRGPLPGLAFLATLDADPRVADHHLLFAVRGHLLAMGGQSEAAGDAFHAAALRTASLPEKRYLERRASQLRSSG